LAGVETNFPIFAFVAKCMILILPKKLDKKEPNGFMVAKGFTIGIWMVFSTFFFQSG